MTVIKFFFFNLVIASSAFAASPGHGAGDPHAIPWGAIGVQAFNVVLLLVLLTYLLSKSVKAHFATRAHDYNKLVERAEVARRDAEKNHQSIKSRLEKLEADAEGSLVRAQAEAEELKKRLLQDAKSMALKLEQEAQRSAQIELEKAKTQLRRELLQSALNVSSESLKTKLSSTEQKKLQNEFVEKIQVVGG